MYSWRCTFRGQFFFFKIMKREERIAHIIVASQLLLNYTSDALADKLFGQQLKMKAKNLQQELLKIEKRNYDYIADDPNAEAQLYNVYNLVHNYANTLCNLSIPDMENVEAMIAAYRKDPKSMNGIVNKILR